MIIIFEYIYIWLINYIRKTYFDIFKSNINLSFRKVKVISLFLYIGVFILSVFLSIILNLFILGLGGHIPPILIIIILFFVTYRIVVIDLKISIKNFYLNDDKWIYRKTSKKIKMSLDIIKILNVSIVKIICLYPVSYIAFFTTTSISNKYSLNTIIFLSILFCVLYFFAIQLRLSISFFYMLGKQSFSYFKIVFIPCFLLILFWFIKIIKINQEHISKLIFNIIHIGEVSNIIQISIYIFFILSLLTSITTHKFYQKASENNFSQLSSHNNSVNSCSNFFSSNLTSFLKKDFLCLYRSFKLNYINYNYILYSVFFFISLIAINKFITLINNLTMINLAFPLYIFFSTVSVIFILEKIINIEGEGNLISLFPLHLYHKIVISKIVVSTSITLIINLIFSIFIFIFYANYWENLVFIFLITSLIILILNLSYHLPYVIFPKFDWESMEEIGTSAKSNILSFIINGFIFSILFSIIMFHYFMTVTNRLDNLSVTLYTILSLSFLLITLSSVLIINNKRRSHFD